MSAIDFPASPTLNQTFVAGNGVTYQWNGTFWTALMTNAGASYSSVFRVLTGSGTYVPSAGVSRIKVRAAGGGGAGGGMPVSTNWAAGGGGAGGYVEKIYNTLAASYAYSVGAGGTGVSAGTGGAGGATTFGSLTAGGGGGGTGGGGGPGGAGGAATGGDVNIVGAAGQGTHFGNGPSQAAGGSGGSNPLGGGGGGDSPGANGLAGGGYGGGGGGGGAGSASLATVGANGSPGTIIVEEFTLLTQVGATARAVGFYAKNSALLNIAGATNTTLHPDVIVSGNEGGWYNTTTGRFTPPAGRFRIYGQVCGSWSGGPTQINLFLRRNGTDWLIASQQVPGNTNWSGDPRVEVTIDTNGTDYFELITSFNNSGAIAKDYMFFGADTVRLEAPFVSQSSTDGFQTGDVKATATANTPSGWYECDGSLKSRTTDAQLFAAIGTTWGAGDGSTTFAVPDFRGRVLAHIDGGAGRLGSGSTGGVITSATLGAVGGQQAHAQAQAEVFPHQHSYGVGGVPANGVNVRGTSGDGTNFGYVLTEGPVGATGAAMNVTQPTAVIRYLIKR